MWAVYQKMFMSILHNVFFLNFNVLKSLEKRKKDFYFPQEKKWLVIFILNLYTWGAQGQMTHLNLLVNSLPRDLLEFVFFLAVGFTAGSVGII